MFTWTDSGLKGCCEASDMGNRHLQRLYDDACDVGFAIKSDKTGLVVKFHMDKVHQSDEGEITHWTYKACTECWRLGIEVPMIDITVFND